ncbi:MAG: hypothetical protein IKZ35_03195 [Clostridia bacterium]|nr:hypothetical protein [Clostridia bacterium]
MKKLKILFMVVALTFALSLTVSAQGDISVYVDGEEVIFDVNPQIIDGRTMVPMRGIFEKLGASVEWVSDTKTIVGTKNEKTVVMQVDDKMLVKDSSVSSLDVAPVIIDGRTLVPVRAVAESLDVSVKWDDVNKSVLITSNDENTYSVILGEELASPYGWESKGWTGDFKNGFKHTIGEVTPLVFNMPENTGTNLYQIEFDVTDCSKASSPNASVAFSVVIGNSEPFITYNGGGPKHYAFGIRSKENGDFKILLTDIADPLKESGIFDGTIKNISIKKIISENSAEVEFLDENGNKTVEMQLSDSSQGNVYLGKNVGQYNTTGELNVGIGKDAMANNTSGYWNTAIGTEALRDNTVGSRNVALGRLALAENISGDRNYAIGTFALTRNTTGRFNIAIGADALWRNTSGQRNIALGSASQTDTTNGNDNISVGHGSMAGRVGGKSNIAIGSYAQKGVSTTNNNNIAIGEMAQYKGGGGDYNISIGTSSGNKMTSVKNANGQEDKATSNVGVGHSTLSNTTTGKYNVGIGHLAGYANENTSNNVYVGMHSGKDNKGSSNTLIGAYSGANLTGGNNNILIGYRVDASKANGSNELNIGNTLYGDLKNKLVGIGTQNSAEVNAILEIAASNGKYPSLLINAGTLSNTLSDGALEFDGVNLYFTRNGVREKLMFESDVKAMIEEIVKEYVAK